MAQDDSADKDRDGASKPLLQKEDAKHGQQSSNESGGREDPHALERRAVGHDAPAAAPQDGDAGNQAGGEQRGAHGMSIPGLGTAVALAQLAIAVCTFGTLVITGRQLTAMQEQLAEMKSSGIDTHNLAEAAKQQAIAITEQADTMKKQLDVFKDQIILATYQQRPIIIVDPGNIPLFDKKDNTINWNVTYSNVGQRVAKNLTISSYISVNGEFFYKNPDTRAEDYSAGAEVFITITKKTITKKC